MTSKISVESPESAIERSEQAGQNKIAAPSDRSSAGAPSIFRSRLWQAIPTVVVLILLLAVGYGGHHSGWKMPRFSELTGQATPSEDDWCAEHSVPASICVACNAQLMPKSPLHGWCNEHGVAECVLRHPETAQLKKLPVITEADLERARRALAIKPRPTNDPACKLHLRRIQFVSGQAADKAGIDIRLVGRGPIVETVSASGEIVYDPTRVVRLSSRAAGTVWRVEKNVGDEVQQGELLALVDAVEVGRAKSELLQAVAQLDLQRKIYQRLSGLEDVVAGRRLQEADAARTKAEIAVQQAIQTLVNLGLSIVLDNVHNVTERDLAEQIQFLGLPPGIVADLDIRRTTANLIPIVAPRDGTIVMRDVVAGEVIDTSKTLFTTVDTSRMWLLLDVSLEDANYVKIGQHVLFRPDGNSQEYEGSLTWISTEADAETRTVKVRAELPNPRRQLRNESFGAGRIVLREEENAIVVPAAAVHWEGCCYVAFVRDKDFLQQGSFKVFHTRMIRPGVTNGSMTEVIAGLLPGEVVVTKGSGVLRAELLKGNLGAG